MSREVSSQVVYAIVRAGGRQEKVSVGDLVTLDRVAGEAGSTIEPVSYTHLTLPTIYSV